MSLVEIYLYIKSANKFLEWWRILIAPDWHWDSEYSQLEFHSREDEMQEKYSIIYILCSCIINYKVDNICVVYWLTDTVDSVR